LRPTLRTDPVASSGQTVAPAGRPVAVLSRLAIIGVVVLAAVAGALSGCHPTGLPALDALYGAAWAALVTYLGSRADRASLIWLAAVATALSKDWLLVPAGIALLIVFASTFRERPSPPVNAVVAALSVTVTMHWSFHLFQGASALAAAAAAAPVVVSGLTRLPTRWRRIVRLVALGGAVLIGVLVIPLLVAGLSTRGQLHRGIGDAEDALHKLTSGNAGQGRQELAAAASDFRSSRSILDAWWTLGARLVPVAAQQRQALTGGVAAADTVTEAAQRESAQIDLTDLRYSGGGVNLARVQALASPLAEINAELLRAANLLKTARDGWDVSPVRHRLETLNADVVRARSSIGLGQEVVADAPSLLGADGVRHYFVAFMDPPESRGLGGILAWYGVLSADRGHLTLTAEGDPLNFENELAQRGGGHISGPADYLARYGQFDPQKYPVDLTYAPDLPTVTDVVSQIYAEIGHPAIDGMLVLDPNSVASVLAYAGPVDVQGFGELTPNNAAELLDKGQYALYPSPYQQDQRKQVLDQALKAASEQLTHGSMNARTLASDLSPLVRSGDLLFWSTHSQDQPLLRQIGLAGAFPTAGGGDLLSFITQNAANNKIDAYLQRTIDYKVSFDPYDGSVSSTLDVTLHNEAPATGLADEVIGSYDGSGLPLGAERLWYSVYTPLQLSGATLDGVPVPMSEAPEFGVHTYSGYVTVPSGATATLQIHLTGRVDSGSYHLQLHDQPTVVPDRISVSVEGAAGWRTASSGNWTPSAQLDPAKLFRFKR
jgi:Protein of unknown function (DUF4012)